MAATYRPLARAGALTSTSSHAASSTLTAWRATPRPACYRVARCRPAPRAGTRAAAASPSGAAVTWQVTVVTHTLGSERAPPMELRVTDLDGNDFPPAPLDQVSSDEAKQRGTGLSRLMVPMRHTTAFDVALPGGLRPAAVQLRIAAKEPEASVQVAYVELLNPEADDDKDGKVRFAANSLVRQVHGWRLFVRDDAWTDRALRDNATIKNLEVEELRAMRGEGANQMQAAAERRPGDRIYGYDTYCDLGRGPALGGGEFKYPRRLATNRTKVDGLEEKPRTSGILEPLFGDASGLLGDGLDNLGGLALPSPWVPDDDNFSAAKSAGFVGTALVGALPNIHEQLGLGVGDEFDSLAEVVSLYDENLINPESAANIRGGRQPAHNFGAKIRENVRGRDATVSLSTGRRRPTWMRRRTLFGRAVDFVGDLVSIVKRTVGYVVNEADLSYLSLVDFAPPRSITCAYAKPEDRCPSFARLSTWASDPEFGRMLVCGMDPLVIQAVASEDALQRLLPEGESAIRAADGRGDGALRALLEGRSLGDWVKEASSAEGGQCRLFVVDYWLLYGFLDEINNANRDAAQEDPKADPGFDKVPHAGRALLFRRNDGRLVPVAIELAHTQGQPAELYLASDPSTVWLAAKLIFLSIQSGYHQLVSHFVRTHACTEPYLIALRRQLSPTHPIFRLLIPHTRYTMPINAGARSLLISKGGVIENAFTPGPFSMRLSACVYGATWQFKDEGLAADLRKRGFPTTAEGLAKFGLEYPYAEDGLLIWDALRDYFSEYVAYYYKSDDEVVADARLQAWWHDVRTNGHPDIPEGWIELQGRDALVDICSTIAWVASAHHAAVNFGQYDYSAWPVSHSSLCRMRAPARGSDAWTRLAELDGFYANYMEAAEKELLRYVAPPAVATKVMSTVKLLSAHAEDEKYLTADGERMEWLPLQQDPGLKAIFDKFHRRMKEIDDIIDERNKDATRLARTPDAGGLPYTLLRPTSELAGVSFRGVPYSISI